ncbi:hypothetical protein BSM4216_2365 [Bacillus smithii]|nr:hypothetical protein BSM4216_2365 [Bacillus smithii]
MMKNDFQNAFHPRCEFETNGGSPSIVRRRKMEKTFLFLL